MDVDGTALVTGISSTKIGLALFLAASSWGFLKLTDATVSTLAKKAPRARFFFNNLASFTRFAMYFLVAYAFIHIFAPTAQTRLALLASTGLAIGLGAQDLIKDLIAGIVILIDRPYQLGDRVRIQDTFGVIDYIGLHSTKLTTDNNVHVSIANSTAIGGLVWNSNAGVPDCLVATEMILPIDVDPQLAVNLGYEAAYSSPYLLRSKPVVVTLSDHFADSPYCVLCIKAFVFDHCYEPRLASDITVRAKREFLDRGMLRTWAAPEE